ncbi:MAG: PilC/PilY family type IV pilus protein [Granulosicoccus sp.]
MNSIEKPNLQVASQIRAFAKGCLLCVMSSTAGLAAADDTEVFFGNAASSGETRPNVMFVLDTSGSMGSRDGYADSRLDRMKDAVRQMLNSDLDMNIGLMNYNGSYGGGPVLYPITTLNKETCAGYDCAGLESAADNVYLVDGNFGDVEQQISDGYTKTDGNVLELGYEQSSQRAVGLRFAEINLARGATILDARLEFVALTDDEDPSSLEIMIENVDDSAAFQGAYDEVTDRSYLTTTVDWTPSEWYEDTVYQSPDIKDLVQAITDRSDWCTGNALTFNIEGTGTREAYSYEKALSDGVDYIPKLRVIQDPSTVVSEDNCGASGTFQQRINSSYDDADQWANGWAFSRSSGDLDVDYWVYDPTLNGVAGLRFHNTGIPQGAVIESAFIRLTGESNSYGTLSVDIYAEDTVESQEYTYYTNGPADVYRDYLPATVAWNDIPDMSTNDVLDTPDLTSIIQALVDKPEWDGGDIDNAISFMLYPTAGNGERDFESYDGSASKAAEIFIIYEDPDGGSGSGSIAAATPAYSGGSSTPVYSTTVARDEMLDVIDGLTAADYTPTVDAYYEAARYMRGERVDYGKQRGVVTDNYLRERFRVSHEDSYTGGILQRDPACTDANLNAGACVNEQIIGDATYISPITGSCQGNHIVLLSDGETNRNSSTSKILSMTGESSCESSGDEACATELATWLATTDHNTDIADVQEIITHTIAFNLGGSGKTFLENVAAAGGGSSYEADSADELLSVFNNIVSTVIDTDTGFTAPAATVNQFNRLTHRDDLYFAVFKPAQTASWDGNIKRFRIGKDSNGDGEVMIRDLDGSPAIDASTGFFNTTARSWWPEKTDDGTVVSTPDGNTVARGGAANQLALDGIDGIGDRRVYTWPYDSASALTTPIDLTSGSQMLHENNSLITDAVLDIVGTKSSTSEQDAYRTSLIQWARGVDVLDSDEDGSTTDIRRSMGDPMHSRPVIVNYGPQTSGGDVRSVIYVGTNEGFLHAFDTDSGQEQFAFIPYELLGSLNTFFDDQQSYSRPYGLDGALSVWREDDNDNQMVDGSDSSYLFFGMRRGGSSYYALDITDPDAPKLAWTIKGGVGGTTGFATMGQSWSRLTPVKMYIEGEEEDVLVFGGGYDENQDRGSIGSAPTHTVDNKGNGIYIVKATTGELLWSGLGALGGTEFFTDMEFGFNGNVRTIDINRDGYVDQMYAADAGGQLWRFDIAQYHSNASDDLVYGGVIADFSGSAASEHRRFYNEPDVALIEGGGERFLSVSIGSGWRAHPLDEITEDRFYMVRQYAVYEKPEGYGKLSGSSYTEITDSDLIDVTDSVSPSSNEYGWYYDFPRTGEKVMGTSITFDNSIIFSTYVPTEQTEVCSAEIGSGRAYVLDAASGAPVVDLDTSADPDTGTPPQALTLSDRSTELDRSGIPPEAMVMITEDSVDTPQILIGGEQLNTGIQNRTRRTFWSDEGESGEIVVTASDEED